MIFASILASVALWTGGSADRFCDGFEDGWESVVNVIAPACPAPSGTTGNTYNDGFREGVKAACRRHPNRC